VEDFCQKLAPTTVAQGCCPKAHPGSRGSGRRHPRTGAGWSSWQAVLISMWPILHHCRGYDTNEVFQLPVFLSCSGEPASPGWDWRFVILRPYLLLPYLSFRKSPRGLEAYPSLTQGLSSVKTCYFATSTREALPRARNELPCGRLSSKTFLEAAAHMAVSCYG